MTKHTTIVKIPTANIVTYSYRSIDVGFDTRVQGMPIILPADITAADYDGLDGEPRTATGGVEEIARELQSAGYLISG